LLLRQIGHLASTVTAAAGRPPGQPPPKKPPSASINTRMGEIGQRWRLWQSRSTISGSARHGRERPKSGTVGPDPGRDAQVSVTASRAHGSAPPLSLKSTNSSAAAAVSGDWASGRMVGGTKQRHKSYRACGTSVPRSAPRRLSLRLGDARANKWGSGIAVGADMGGGYPKPRKVVILRLSQGSLGATHEPWRRRGAPITPGDSKQPLHHWQPER
jgi:hypothetical protein